MNFTAATNVSTNWSAIAVVLNPKIILPPASISSPGALPSANVPWFGLGGVAAVPPHAPVITRYDVPGTFTYTVDTTWMVGGDYFDIVMCTDGGGGSGGSTIFAYGAGGFSGNWSGITLVYGVDVPLSTTSFTVTVLFGAGGVIEVYNGQPGSGVQRRHYRVCINPDRRSWWRFRFRHQPHLLRLVPRKLQLHQRVERCHHLPTLSDCSHLKPPLTNPLAIWLSVPHQLAICPGTVWITAYQP